jgi:hypothetical protein
MSKRRPDDAEARDDAGPLYAFASNKTVFKFEADVPVAFKADGVTFSPAHDTARLNDQLKRVMRLMLGGGWHTLREISDATGDPESSVSARLRDLRKQRFGGWTVERRRRTQGTHEYQVRA